MISEMFDLKDLEISLVEGVSTTTIHWSTSTEHATLRYIHNTEWLMKNLW